MVTERTPSAAFDPRRNAAIMHPWAVASFKACSRSSFGDLQTNHPSYCSEATLDLASGCHCRDIINRKGCGICGREGVVLACRCCYLHAATQCPICHYYLWVHFQWCKVCPYVHLMPPEQIPTCFQLLHSWLLAFSQFYLLPRNVP